MEKQDQLINQIQILIAQYSQWGIVLSANNILCLLTIKSNLDDINFVLKNLLNEGNISVYHEGYYFCNKYRNTIVEQKIYPSAQKIVSATNILKFLSLSDKILFIGISGSSAFNFVKENDDLDIFVITKKDNLFLVRFIFQVISIFSGKFRNRASVDVKDKVCANVILEVDSLLVPYPKRNLFSARELAFIFPFYDSGGIFQKFIDKNKLWASNMLPNCHTFSSSHVVNDFAQKTNIIDVLMNKILSFLQLWYMKPKVTNELLSVNQLWLHPNIRI